MRVADLLRTHLQDPRFTDQPTSLVRPGDNRLTHEYEDSSANWKVIGSLIDRAPGLAWFPDANVAIYDDTEPVWTALRIAGFRGGKTMLSHSAAMELAEWFKKPFRNADRSAAFADGLEKRTWADRFCLDSALVPAMHHYARMFSVRRMLCLEHDAGKTIVNTDPANSAETMNAIGKHFGERSHALAKKGRKDAEAGKPINLLDEYHCLSAIFHAVVTGQETAILTADADCLEIFRKAQWFFTTHYRAWAVAPKVKGGEYGQPELVIDPRNTKDCFKGPLSTYPRHSNRLPEALPAAYSKVPVHLMYLGPNGRYVRMTSFFEREMRGMLEVRARTGRCTELFGEQNIHIDLGPIEAGSARWIIGVGEDEVLEFQDPDCPIKVPVLDLMHAANSRERTEQLR